MKIFVLLCVLIAVCELAWGDCPYGWSKKIGDYGQCVKGFAILKTYIEALEYCNDIAAHATLISIHNAFQNAQIASLEESAASCDSYWIGLYDLDKHEYGYDWADGTPMDYENWASGYPEQSQEATVVYMDLENHNRWLSTDQMFIQKCFVCETGNQASTVVPTSPRKPSTYPWPRITASSDQATTPSSYLWSDPEPTFGYAESTSWMGTSTSPFLCEANAASSNTYYCYAYHDDIVDQLEAFQRCEGPWSNLVSIRNQYEENDLEEVLRRSVWIGLQRLGTEWKWSDGSSYSYGHWYPGYPTSQANADCVATEFTSGLWRNVPCDEYHSFICKYQP